MRNATVIQMVRLVKIVTLRLANVNADLVSLEELAINVLLDISNSPLMDAKVSGYYFETLFSLFWYHSRNFVM